MKVKIDVRLSNGNHVEMEAMRPHEIEDIDEGKTVLLVFVNNESYSGIFEGMDGDTTIMLRSMDSKHTIGLPLEELDSLYVEI